MINPGLNVNKSFKGQVEKWMNIVLGGITKTYINATLEKNNTSVLTLVIFYETRAEKKAYKVSSCVICTIIKNYVFIDYIACQ